MLGKLCLVQFSSASLFVYVCCYPLGRTGLLKITKKRDIHKWVDVPIPE